MATKVWNDVSGGRWQDDANWLPMAAATAADDAIITGPGTSSAAVVATAAGTGASASLKLSGDLTLSGTFNTGALTIGNAAQPTAVTFATASITATSLTLAGTTLVLGDGASNSAFRNKFEVGTAGTAGFGIVQVDAGASITGFGTMGGFYNNGIVRAEHGTLHINAWVSGSGELQVGDASTLDLQPSNPSTAYNIAVTEPVRFAGRGGTLSIGSTYYHIVGYSPVLQQPIYGFEPGDIIRLTGQSYSAVTYNPGVKGGPGSISLQGPYSNEGLAIAGNYSDFTFVATPNALGTDITLVNKLAPTPGVLFDSAFYLSAYRDVAAAGVDAYRHYVAFGWHEGREPNAFFDTNYYLQHNPDVRASGMDPLTHYQLYGWKEGRDPGALFSDSKYLAANPDVRAAGIDPLTSYLTTGQAQGRLSFLVDGNGVTNPLVNPAYLAAQSTVSGAGFNQIATPSQTTAEQSFHTTGWQTGLNPNAFFDTGYYLSHNLDVAAAHVDPLLHYETYGWTEGRDPSAQFSTAKYLAAYADVKAAGMDPLLHYIEYGAGEGRTAFTA